MLIYVHEDCVINKDHIANLSVNNKKKSSSDSGEIWYVDIYFVGMSFPLISTVHKTQEEARTAMRQIMERK